MGKGKLTGYTRVHHRVLALFQLGLLSKREMQICAVVMRESWGWERGNNNWTHRRLQNEDLVELSRMAKTHVSQVLRLLLDDRVILEKDRRENGALFSFNEHAEEWRGDHKLSQDVLEMIEGVARVTKSVTGRVTKPVTTQGDQNGNQELPKGAPEVTESVTGGGVENQPNPQSKRQMRERLEVPKDSSKDSSKGTSKEGGQPPPSPPKESRKEIQDRWINYTQERWQEVFDQEIKPSEVQLLVHGSKKLKVHGFRSFETLHVWISDREAMKREFTGSAFLYAKKLCTTHAGIKGCELRAWKDRDALVMKQIFRRIEIQGKA